MGGRRLSYRTQEDGGAARRLRTEQNEIHKERESGRIFKEKGTMVVGVATHKATRFATERRRGVGSLPLAHCCDSCSCGHLRVATRRRDLRREERRRGRHSAALRVRARGNEEDKEQGGGGGFVLDF